MNITDALNSTNIFSGIEQITREESRRDYKSVQHQATPSGDTVDISDEAKKLYSEMIHKYDKAGSQSSDKQQNGEASGDGSDGATKGSGGAGATGGGSSSSNADQIEQIKKQIQSLKSQMMALASQAQNGGTGSAAMNKLNSLQSQIAALEAQLNEMEQA